MSSNLILPPNARIDGTLSNITASVVNTRSGMGTARDKSTYNFAGAFLPFTQQERGVIHAGSFEVKRVTEKLPMHMTAKGWTVEIADGKPELVAEFDKYARRLKLQSAFKKAEFYRNLHDGAVIFLLIDDGRKPDEPVDEARIRTIHPITPKYILDRWKVTPSDQTEEPEFYSVIQYSNVLSAKGDRLSYEYADWRGQVHHSRCLRFDDGLADDWIRRLNQGWSPGIFHQFLKPFLDYFSGFQALGAMLQDASLFTYAINGLMQQILDGNEKLIRDRLTENWLATSNYGAIIHDAEHEKVGFTERSLAGWDSSLSRLENRLVAASGLPHSVLLGRAGSGGGLDGNGESEAKLMVEVTHDQQENSFRDKLEYLYRLITLAKDGPTQGKEIDHEVKFNPIYTPTQQEQAELESLVIQKDVQAIGAGIYTAEDALRSHYSTNEFNPSITIDWDKKEKEFAQQQEQAAAEEAALAEQEGAIAPEEEAPEEAPAEGFNLEEFTAEQTDSADPHLDDRYSHINFYPPTFMRKAAKRGLELRRKFGRGGLSIQEASDQGIGSGVARARDIANGAQLSPDTIKRMHAYFSRHQRDKKKGWDDPKNPTNGFIAWNLWGDSGDGKGWRWVKDRIAQMELADRKAKDREDGFNQVRDRMGRFARTRGAELAGHLGENVISWGTGKVIGGLVAQIGTAHGIDPDLSKRLGETAVQALTATALHARHTRDPLELGEKFISEAAAAFLGKASHSAVDDSIAGADEHVRAIASLITGKTVGTATAATVARGLRRQSKAIGRLLATQRHDDVCGDIPTRTDVQPDLSRLEQAALFDLTLAGYLLAAEGDRADGKPCGRGWDGTKPGCRRAKTRQESVDENGGQTGGALASRFYQQLKQQDNANLFLSNAGTSYAEAIDRFGQSSADQMLDQTLRRLADIKAKRRIEQITTKAKERAISELHPWFDLNNVSLNGTKGFERFRENHPKLADTLLEDYKNKLKKKAQDRDKSRRQKIDEELRQRHDLMRQSSFDNTPAWIKKITQKLGQPNLILPKTDAAYFHPPNGISMDHFPDYAFRSTYHHEYGHFVDHQLGDNQNSFRFRGISSSGAARQAFTADAKNLKAKQFHKIINQLNKTEVWDATSRDYSNILYDIGAALSNNRFGAGHSSEYWRRPGARESETFANIFAIAASGNPILNEAAKKLSPNMYDFVVGSLKKIK